MAFHVLAAANAAGVATDSDKPVRAAIRRKLTEALQPIRCRHRLCMCRRTSVAPHGHSLSALTLSLPLLQARHRGRVG